MNIIVGVLSGICASMGLGGGFILLLYLSVFTNTDAVSAAGTNLIFFLAIAVPAMIIHFKNRMIEVKPALFYALAGTAGAILGSCLSGFLDKAAMRKLMALIFILFGVREMVSYINGRRLKNNSK